MAENLWAISIDPDESPARVPAAPAQGPGDARPAGPQSRIFNYLAAATPGLKELVTIGKIWELAQPDRKVKKGREYDLVIVDAPATGHGDRLPADARAPSPASPASGPIHSQATQLDGFITDHETTGVAIVSLPEEMPVNESASLEQDADATRSASRWTAST